MFLACCCKKKAAKVKPLPKEPDKKQLEQHEVEREDFSGSIESGNNADTNSNRNISNHIDQSAPAN